MKCTECPEYIKCRSRYDLRIKRHRCHKAKEPKVYTYADHVRAMSDFELMQFLRKLDSQDLGDVIKFCRKSHVCDELDVDEITEGLCQRCLLAQLQQPYESPTGQKG